MKCPICKNTMGFVCGTCIRCGYDQLDHKFKYIEVSVDVLEALLPEHVVDRLIDEHERHKMQK